ncbi:hypothetical protein V8D89_003656 [Ganoderma adspersum]
MSDLSYPSSVSHFNTLLEWVKLCRWCLFTLACALVQLEGGVDAVLGRQKVLVVYINPAHHTAHGGNPAAAFQLAQAALVERDKEDFLRKHWMYLQANADLCGFSAAIALRCHRPPRPRAERRVHGPRREPPGRVHLSGHAFALFRLPLRHVASEDAADARTRAALEDLVRLMKRVFYMPFVFHRAEDPREPQPDLGFLEHTGRWGKTWRWKDFPAGDEELRRMREKLLYLLMLGGMSDLTPLQVLMLFDYGRMGTKWWYVSSSLLCC